MPRRATMRVLVRSTVFFYNYDVLRIRATSFLLFCIVVLGLFLRLSYYFSTPLGLRSHDITTHMKYIDYVSQTWNIPSSASEVGTEFHQPPLFYYMGAALKKVGIGFGLNMIDFRLIRAAQLSFSFDVVFLLLWIATLLFKDWLPRTLFFAGTVTFPGLIFPNADINNDMLLQLLLILSFGLLLQWWKKGETRDAVFLAVSISAAIITKLTGLLCLLVILAPFFHPRLKRTKRLRHALILSTPLLPFSMLELWRCWLVRSNWPIVLFLPALVIAFKVFIFFILPLVCLVLLFRPNIKQLKRLQILSLLSVLAISAVAFVGWQHYSVPPLTSSPAATQWLSRPAPPSHLPFNYYFTFNPVRVLNDYNRFGPATNRFWEYLYKSAYSGEWNFGPNLLGIVRLMEGLGMLLLLLASVGIWREIHKPSKVALPISVIFVAWLSAILAYHLYMPASFNQDFRFVSLVTLPFFYFVVQGMGKPRGTWSILTIVLITSHAACCSLFFLFLLGRI